MFSKEDHAEARITSRWKIEQEKLENLFPDATLLSQGEQQIERVRFTIHTRFGTERPIYLVIPPRYPNDIPRAYADGWEPESGSGHLYGDGRLCVQDDNQWSRDGSISLVLSRTAKWVDKYEIWLNSGESGSRTWPGSQHR